MSEDRVNRLSSFERKKSDQGHEDFPSWDPSMLALGCPFFHPRRMYLYIIPKTKYLSIYYIYLNLYILNIKQGPAF